MVLCSTASSLSSSSSSIQSFKACADEKMGVPASDSFLLVFNRKRVRCTGSPEMGAWTERLW